MISTELTRRLGIDHPVIQAGMARWSGAALASAVSNAGGLGTIGSIGSSLDNVRTEIEQCRASTAKPFSINLVTWDWAPFAREFVDLAIAERVPIVTLSFGEPLAVVERCRSAGLKVIVQVQDLEGAKAAIATLPDALIVQGNEAGGHTGRRGTLSFAAQVLDMAGDVPVVVGGGVGSGRGLAAALAMGAAGVVMGTRFKATHEFAIEPAVKEAVVASDGSNTVYDEVVDLAYGGRWPNGVAGRVLRNRFTDTWAGRSEALMEMRHRDPDHFGAELDRDPETRLNWAGESSGLVHEVMPAAEVVRKVVAEAEGLLAAAAALGTAARP